MVKQAWHDKTFQKLWLMAAVLVLGLLYAKPGYAQESKVTGCAPDAWKALKNQAVLEARRETVMNQHYIRKPDSVLHYSCFGYHMQHSVEHTGPIFNETDSWIRNVDLIGKNFKMTLSRGGFALDAAILGLVLTPLNTYLNSNFNHNYLGGTSNIARPRNYTELSEAGACKTMANVWKAAKCANFDDEEIFYTFEELTKKDPRKYPQGLECNSTAIEQEHIDIAKNKDFQHAEFTKIKTYAEHLLDDTGCKLTIPTGVKVQAVYSGKWLSYDGGVCAMPGCSIQAGLQKGSSNPRCAKEKN